MKTRLITTLTALTLTVVAGAAAHAETSAVTLEWQQPGYVMDVIVVTAPRPTLDVGTTETATLAWQEPGYVTEVVIAKASRSEVLAGARAAAREAALARQAVFARGVRHVLGAPAR